MQFLVLGSHWGTVYVLDHQGNAVRGKDMAIHATSVNHLSLDENGDFLASCSDDGKVNFCLYCFPSNWVEAYIMQAILFLISNRIIVK